MYRRLAITDKPDTFLHECTDIESIGETCVGRNDSAAAHFSNGNNHLTEGVNTLDSIYYAKTHLTVSGTSVSSISVFWILCIMVLGS